MLSQLLNKWRMERVALIRIMRTDYGTESPERNQIAYASYRQLSQCIEELEAITEGSPMTELLANILLKAYNESK